MDEQTREILQKYQGTISGDFGDAPEKIISKDYDIFRAEALEGRITFYEQSCNLFERMLRVKASEKDRAEILRSIETVHLRITPEGAASFASVVAMLIILLGILVGGLSYIFGEFYLVTTLFLVLTGAFLIKPLMRIPNYIAAKWRLGASNQMVLCILYVVIYMRHTSNLEHAVKFAGEHVGLPLSLDLRKVLWDVETGNFLTIKESLDYYLEGWKEHSPEFVEAFHLIEGSLYEPKDDRRIELLEKSLEVMLEGTYERMLHYAHNLKSPITILHMLGIILPVLGLVMFPLIGSFLSGAVRWYHLAILYNLLLPVFVYVMGNNILSKRPTGYGESEVLSTNPELKALSYVPSAVFLALIVGGSLVAMGLLPILVHVADPNFDATFLGYKFLDYKNGFGPYGFWSVLLSLLIPFGVAIGIAIYLRMKNEQLVKYKVKTDELERGFSGAIFQLGNRIGDGIPVEAAFRSVSESMRGTESGDFFAKVDHNLREQGMGLKDALFHEEKGAVAFYPSKLIESSMRVLLESARKGAVVASKSLITISNYTNRIRQVNDRLQDLMADVISSMTSQISFLTPVIAGIVVGVGSMVVTIINLLGEQFASTGAEGEGLTGGISAIASILRIEDVVPGFQFQLIVGLYVVEIVVLLTLTSTMIERGVDMTTAKFRMSKNLVRSMVLYSVISLAGIILFNLLAQAVSVVSTTS